METYRLARLSPLRLSKYFDNCTFARQYSDADKQKMLNQLLSIGRKKPLGYLPRSTLLNICDVDPRKVVTFLRQKGMKAFLLKSSECRVGSGALYAYHPVHLQAFLDKPDNARILKTYQWPENAADFVMQVATVMADPEKQKPLYDLIAYAFDDPRAEYRFPSPSTTSRTRHRHNTAQDIRHACPHSQTVL